MDGFGREEDMVGGRRCEGGYTEEGGEAALRCNAQGRRGEFVCWSGNGGAMHTAIGGCWEMCQKDGRDVAPIERDKGEKKKWLTESERRREEKKGRGRRVDGSS